MAYFNLLTPGVYSNEIDLSDRTRPAATNTSAVVFWSLFGPLEKTLTTSRDSWISTYGNPDPAVSYATYSALMAHYEINQMYNLRVTNRAKHAGVSFLTDREARLSHLSLDPFDDGFISPKETNHAARNAWEKGAYDVVGLVFSDELVASNIVTIKYSITGSTETGSLVDGEDSVVVPFNTDSDQTMLDLAQALKDSIDAIVPGSVVDVLVVNGASNNDRTIRYSAPKNCLVGFTELTVTGGAAQPEIVVESLKLFDVYAANPGKWGNNIAVRWSQTDQGQPQQLTMRFSRALVSGNVFACTINGNAVNVPFFGTNDATLANVAVALQQAMGPSSSATVVEVGGGSSNDREIILKAPNALSDVVVQNAVVTGGVTQPNVITTEKITRIGPDGTFLFEVFNAADLSAPLEQFEVSLADQQNADGLNTNIAQVINLSSKRSKYIRIYQPDWSKNCDIRRYVPLPTTQNVPRYMTGGDDGFAPTAADFVRAWESFSNRDQNDIRILINGGYAVPSIQRAMVRLAEFRRDCIAILDIPRNYQAAQDAVNYRRNELNVNSSYAAIYSPWCTMDDVFTGRRLSLPPSGFVAAVYAKTDRVAYEWYAPAGINRGDLSAYIDGLDVLYERGETDLLFANQINFIIKKKGFPIWAAETLQYKASALSNVSVRRLLITVEVSIADTLDYNVFDPNDDDTRFAITQKCENLLSPIKQARGLYDYLVICDERNNPAEAIDAYVLVVDVYVKPVLPTKYIKVNTIITRTGANFQESVMTTLPQAA